MSSLVALVGALAVNQQHAAAMVGVTKEAQDVARVVSFLLMSGSNKLSESAQEIVAKLHKTQGRDVVLVDSNRLVLADALPSQIGKSFTEDPGGEVEATIKDRQVRTFVEVSQEYPAGIKQIVVPVEAESGQVIGAVVLEYTPLYNELMRLTRSTIRHVALAGFGSVAIALLIAFYMGRSIARPLQQLTNVATGFASGRRDLPMPSPRKDEIGELATAFHNMVQKRQRAEDELRRLRDELEARVTERVAELAEANEALRTENIERKRGEETLRESEEKFRQLADNITDVFWMTSPDLKKIYYVSPGYELIWGRSTESVYDDPHQWVDAILPEERERVFGAFASLIGNVPEVSVEYRITRPDGTIRWVHDRGFQVRDASGSVVRLTGIASDITTRKRFEAQLFQSQKMEIVGKLAGGVAHEFNSIITAIIGQSELLLADLPAGSPLAKSAMEISEAASRAATLTRQLQAYGRKQLLKPETLDLNGVIAGMEGMFRHLMGGDVDTQIVPAVGLQAVKADAGQIERVILNMAINARDAMPSGGKFMLETANISFDEESVGRYPELKPGDYVMLAITDTGKGMSAEEKARVFEPFFSTKDVGQGVGLGLSICYGIIKQSGGHISVYSELARGTTFKIYLPQVEHQIPIQRFDSPDLPRGTETILLVEDDPALREMAATLLRRLGYTVLAAADGLEALSLKHQRDIGHIDLLFSDVVMPHMSGKELSERMRAIYPHTRILFTSAYTENAIIHQGVLNKGLALLQKPFTPSALAHKLREVLDQPANRDLVTSSRGAV